MDIALITCALILSVLLAFIIVRQSIITKAIQKNKLALSFVLVFALVMLLVFYEQLNKRKYFDTFMLVFMISIYSLIGLFFTCMIIANQSKTGLEKEFVKSLEVDKLFVLLDKHEKIKEISTLLAKEFGFEKEQLIGKKFLDCIEFSFEVVTLNDVNMKMNRVKEFFKEYQNRVKEGSVEKREFVLMPHSASDPVVLNFNDIAIFTASKYTGHLLIGDKRNTDSLMTVEKELILKNEQLEAIKERFTSLLGITEESIFFYNIGEKYIWGNDSYVKVLGLQGNSIGKDGYEAFIHKDDIAYYNKIIAGLTKENPAYEITYRFKTGANYSFIREVGKRTFTKDCDEIVGYVTKVNNKHYERSNIESLDNAKSVDELASDVTRLYNEKKTFELVSVRIDSIPEINASHNRGVGNMVLGEFVKALTSNFINDDLIYRVGGLEFVFITTDFRKMDLLKKMLETRRLTNTMMQYGSLKLDVESHFGIALSTDASTTNELIKASYKALKTALLPQVTANYVFYKDIR